MRVASRALEVASVAEVVVGLPDAGNLTNPAAYQNRRSRRSASTSLAVSACAEEQQSRPASKTALEHHPSPTVNTALWVRLSRVRVLIGHEAGLGTMEDVGLVATSYGSREASGTLGVIGPTRMDYAKVVPLVGFTAQVMSDVLAGRRLNDDDELE